MKKLWILLMVLVSFSNSTFGQDSSDDDIKTLLSGKVRISAFGGVIFSFADTQGQLSYLSGGGGAIIFDRSFFLGGYGLSSNQDITIKHDVGNSLLGIRHGGFWLGYNILPKAIVHPTTSVKIGWGNVSLHHHDNQDSEYFRQTIFVVEPEIGAEVNIAKFFKLGVNGSYRFVKNSTDIKQYDVNSLNGFALNIHLKFGWFN